MEATGYIDSISWVRPSRAWEKGGLDSDGRVMKKGVGGMDSEC